MSSHEEHKRRLRRSKTGEWTEEGVKKSRKIPVKVNGRERTSSGRTYAPSTLKALRSTLRRAVKKVSRSTKRKSR